jgi:hypothetical protein
MPTEIGVIEGFFGRPWTWAERTETLRFLGGRGYGFWLYAPKADPYLRRRWREPYPEAELAELRAFAAACRDADVRFGVGLTPFELHFGFDQMAKAALSAKLAVLDDAGVQDLAILFDDMKGDVPDLAARQAEIVHWVGPRTKASRLIMCPSYYSDDPVLDRVFGVRPAGYLDDLGRTLDAAVHAVNPASQPVLSRIPMLTLVEAYARGEGYQYLAAFRRAASEVLGEALAARVEADLLSLEDAGLDRLGERQATLAARYAAFDHPAAREIVDWLEGGYAITGEALQTQ